VLNPRQFSTGIRLLLVLFLSIGGLGIAHAADAPAPKVVVVEFHGLRNGIIQQNLGKLPHFREIIKGLDGNQSHIHLSKVFTTIPAASVPACTAMYTGRHPQNTGVVSTIWFDRELLKVRTMISYGQQRINRILVQNNVKTLFEYLGSAGKTSLSAMLMIDKGANWSIKSGMFFWGNGSAVGFARNQRWFPDPWYMDHKTISAALTGHLFAYHKSLSGLLKKQGEIPDVSVIQLLGTDITSHFPDKPMIRQKASMAEIQSRYAQDVLDPEIGRLLHFFKANDLYRNMIFFLISQQGSLKIDKHVPDAVVSEILKTGFKLPRSRQSCRDAEAVVMPGACTKEIYLKNRRTQSWIDPPRLIEDVKPALDLLLADDRIRNCLEAIVIRQYPGERNEGLPENTVWWELDRHAYPNSPRSDVDFLKALIPLDKALRQFELKDYITEGLKHQYTRKTAPDIKLINKKGVYFEVDFQKYGHHGSYYPEDTCLSFWIAGPGLETVIPGQHVIDAAASTLDLIPMIAYLLDLPQPEGLDGGNPLAGLK